MLCSSIKSVLTATAILSHRLRGILSGIMWNFTKVLFSNSCEDLKFQLLNYIQIC